MIIKLTGKLCESDIDRLPMCVGTCLLKVSMQGNMTDMHTKILVADKLMITYDKDDHKRTRSASHEPVTHEYSHPSSIMYA